MKISMKRELLNDVVTGLLVAAAFAAVAPVDAWADLNGTVGNAQSNVMGPAMKVVTMVCYGLGAVLTVTGIAGAKKHADSPGTVQLGPALGKLGAGGAFLAAPTVIGMIQSTGNSTFTDTATYSSSTIGF